MLIVLAVVCGASLSAFGSNTLDEVMQALGFGRVSAIAAEQRRQAAVLAALEPMVGGLASDIGTLSRRIKAAHHDETVANDRLALIEADIAALVAETKSRRAAHNESASSAPWRAPIDQLERALFASHGDVLALRSSLEEHDQTFRKALDERDLAYRKEMGSITRRLDRLEHTVSRDLTASIRVAARKKVVRRKPRARAVPAGIALRNDVSAPQAAFVVPAGQPH